MLRFKVELEEKLPLKERLRRWWGEKVARKMLSLPCMHFQVMTHVTSYNSVSEPLPDVFMIYKAEGKIVGSSEDIVAWFNPLFQSETANPSAFFLEGRSLFVRPQMLPFFIDEAEIYIAESTEVEFGNYDGEVEIAINAVHKRFNFTNKYPYNSVVKIGSLNRVKKGFYFNEKIEPIQGSAEDLFKSLGYKA